MQVLQVHDTRYFVFLSELLTLQVLDKHLLGDQRDFATLKTIQPAVFHFCVTNRKSSSGLARNSHVFLLANEAPLTSERACMTATSVSLLFRCRLDHHRRFLSHSSFNTF